MNIAVASQNRREITGHTGRCMKFCIFAVDDNTWSVISKTLLEFVKEHSFHETSPHQFSPLDGVQVLIAGGMGSGLVRRLQARHINSWITREPDQDRAGMDFF